LSNPSGHTVVFVTEEETASLLKSYSHVKLSKEGLEQWIESTEVCNAFSMGGSPHTYIPLYGINDKEHEENQIIRTLSHEEIHKALHKIGEHEPSDAFDFPIANYYRAKHKAWEMSGLIDYPREPSLPDGMWTDRVFNYIEFTKGKKEVNLDEFDFGFEVINE